MSNNEFEPEGLQLLEFFEIFLGELEWRTCTTSRAKYKNTFIDQSISPPYASFRFKNERLDVINLIKEALSIYRGKIEWVMVERKRDSLPGINRSIMPKRLLDVKEKAERVDMYCLEYMKKYEPEFSPPAHADLINLTKHIKAFFFAQHPEVLIKKE